MAERVLVVDDDPFSREFLAELLRCRGSRVIEACDGNMALEALAKEPIDLVLSDVRMPGLDGLALVRRTAALGGPPVILVTAFGELESAIEAMRAGARDYLVKPVTLEDIERAIDRTLRSKSSERASAPRSPLAEGAGAASAIVGRSPALLAALDRALRAAGSKTTVLLQGESGTGKELFAALIHGASERRRGPYVKVNCAALAEGVLESELFGHERGAFTGAVERRAGRFELAHGGTILLDEVTEISPAVQAKLLRVLEEEEFERVGGSRTIRVDVRIVATTNRDMGREIARGSFRSDLYFRLAVLPIHIPPLRERPGDVPLLVEHFIARYRGEIPTRVERFSPEALALLERYDWPGNVRELENLVRRVMVLDPGPEVGARDLMGDIGALCAAAAAPERSLAATEREAIERALIETSGNRTRAAALLGISVRTLFNRLKQYEKEGAAIGAIPLSARRVSA